MMAGSRALDKIYKRRDRYEIPDWQREDVWDQAKKQELIRFDPSRLEAPKVLSREGLRR
jgi:hypothetical protein